MRVSTDTRAQLNTPYILNTVYSFLAHLSVTRAHIISTIFRAKVTKKKYSAFIRA